MYDDVEIYNEVILMSNEDKLKEQHKKIFSKKLNYYMRINNKQQDDIVNDLNINKSTISTWCRGVKMPRVNAIQLLADYFGVTITDFLVDDYNTPTISNDNIEFAVIGDVAAGFDKIAIEDWTGDKILIPSSYLKGRNKDDFFVLRIKGDSMYPMYIDGDKVLVLKQNATDYNGQVAVAIYNDDNGTIKKIEQRKNAVYLVPINPQYQPVEIKGTDIERLHILGIPKLLIREIEDE